MKIQTDDGSEEEEEEQEQEEGKSCRYEIACCGCCLLVVLACLLTRLPWGSDSPPPPTCFGFDECPEYPMPYDHGDWPKGYEMVNLSRLPFPDGFVWGMGTAAYQIEGGYRQGGRGASIWDTYTGANTVGMPGANCSYCCKVPPCTSTINEGMRARGNTGNVACNHFGKWKDDIALMQSMNMSNYRFSISWSRVVPTGRVSDGVSDAGVKFYSDLIDGLLEADITPYVTLYHWDLPQGLLDPPRNMAWWSHDPNTLEPTGEITKDFVDYADLCFKSFGDRVKFWTTFNEPWTCLYLDGAPNVDPFKQNASFIAVHNLLNAHAAAVDHYRKHYQAKQGGKIGITLNQDWKEPNTTSPADIAASERLLLHQLGWLAHPIFSGTADYPAELRRVWGDKLPRFTEDQKQLIDGSADFFGLNTYATNWASQNKENNSGWEEAFADTSSEGFAQAQSSWLYGGAWGFRKLLNWISRRYSGFPIYVTESGWSQAADSPEIGVQDMQRLSYFFNYTYELQLAIVLDKVDVRGYFAWSLMDNFEWTMGYEERFGVVYTDYALGFDANGPLPAKPGQPTPNQKRYRKQSSCWLQALWMANAVVGIDDPIFVRCNASLGTAFAV